jgi:hypothetical protein
VIALSLLHYQKTQNLAKLRHLDVSKQPGHVRMPAGVGQLMHLQSLPVLNVGEGLSDCSIKELRDLDNFKGWRSYHSRS